MRFVPTYHAPRKGLKIRMSKPVRETRFTAVMAFAVGAVAPAFRIRKAESGGLDLVDPAGEVCGNFATAEEAIDAARGLFAIPDPAVPETPTGARFEMRFTQGDKTVDGRVIDKGSMNLDRPVPLPAMLMTETAYGHEGAQLCGSIDETVIEGDDVVARGYFDAGSEAGQEAERLVRDGLLTTWSPDVGNVTSEIEIMQGPEANGDMLGHLVAGTLIGGTIVPFPALSSAKISIIDDAAAAPAPATPPAAEPTPTEPAQAAAANVPCETCPDALTAGAPIAPPRAWFDDPHLTEPTPLTITDEGHIFGHAAQWGTCHTGDLYECVLPPNSLTDYAYFRLGGLKTQEGPIIATGTITMETGHASLAADPRTVRSHYDNTGVAVADVACGEDAIGIWFAGALRPGVSDEQIRNLRASKMSGDWRPMGAGSELMALLAVNVPGFPITRARVASGHQIALVAAGVVVNEKASLERKMASLESIVMPLLPVASEKLVERIRGARARTE